MVSFQTPALHSHLARLVRFHKPLPAPLSVLFPLLVHVFMNLNTLPSHFVYLTL